jgi:hypothetical protein
MNIAIDDVSVMLRNPLSPRSQPILTLAFDDNSTVMELSDDDQDIPEYIVTETQAIPIALTSQQIIILPPPTLTTNQVLREVCKNIFDSLEEQVNSRNQAIHLINYEDKWNNLREVVNVTPRFPNIKIS